jgi:chromosome segregation ATPase
MEGIHDQMAQSVQIEQQAKRVLEKSEKKRDEAKRTEAKHAEAVEEEQKRHGDVVDKATRYTRQLWGETWDGVARPDDVKKYKSQEAVKARIEHTEGIKAKALKRRGVTEVDPEVAKEKMDRARHAYFEKESGCKQIEREGDQLKQDAQERWNRLKRIRQYICRRSNNAFDNILQAKGSAGKLDFEHKEKTLGLTYQKDNADDDNIITNITSLSGGERSFSTLAMLIALGATIECPFRVMDEFDVFMDQVSRKVAMKELVDMAKKMENRQFIFITPQDLSSLPQSDILKIFKMNPPIRGQRTLEEAFATQG